jgi:hypothetical protein
MGAASNSDFGMYSTGKSVYGLWQSGGFAVGFNAVFNKGKQIEIAPYYANQLCYDGSQYYWAVGSISGAAGVFYSSDLINWTQTLGTPSIRPDSWIQVAGSGSSATIIVGGNYADSYQGNTAESMYYSTNMGGAWAQTPSGAAQGWSGSGLVTHNATYPLVAIAGFADTASDVAAGLFFYTSSVPSTGGNYMNKAVTVGGWTSQGNYSTYFSMARAKQGFGCFQSTAVNATSNANVSMLPQAVSCAWYIAPLNSDLHLQSSYVKTATAPGLLMDICYFAPTNSWYTVGYGGLYSAPDSGTSASNAIGPTAAWNNVVPLGSLSLWAIETNGTIMVAVGQDPANNLGAIYTSTDGVTWTKVNRFYTSNAAGVKFTGVLWDGQRFVLTGCLNAGIIATSPDGIAWTVVYYPDYAEAAGTGCGSFMGVYSGTINASGAYVSWTGAATQNAGFGVAAAAASNGSRTVSGIVINGAGSVSTQPPSASVPTTPPQHYYELIFTAVAGSPNLFTVQVAIDGVIQGAIPTNTNSGLLAAATDTAGTSKLFINLPRTGNWTVIDDIYFTDFAPDPAGNVGQMGIVNIIPDLPSSDFSDQYARTGIAASNAAQVATALSNSEGSVYTYTVGGKDVYNTNPNIPANYQVQAVQVEGYFSRYGSAGATASIGILSNGAEVDSAQVSAKTVNAAYASMIQSVDPKTNQPWTISAARAAQFVITKVT